MEKDRGWIYLHKKMLDWEWYGDINVFRLFIHLLLKANYTETKWKGIKIKRGQHLTGRHSLSRETGLTEQQIRTAIAKLISTNEITKVSTNQYTIITIINYDKYQPENQPNNQRVTNEQPTDNHSLNKISKINKRNIPKGIGKSQLELVESSNNNSKESSSFKEKKTYGNSDINSCIEYLGEKLDSTLDGTITENRRYCYNLLRKMKKDFPEMDAVENVKLLIDSALNDKFHSRNATGFKYLYYNTQRIAQSFKGEYGIGESHSDLQVI